MKSTLSDIYNEFAEDYENNRGAFNISEILNKFYTLVNTSKGALLDLGCGAGEPVAKYYIDKQWSAVGVDFSSRMLEMANKFVPKMETINGNILSVDFDDESFDAVVATYSLFHIKAKKHKALFEKIHHWLKPNGCFLFTYATKSYTGKAVFEGYKTFMGRELFYSHKTPEELYTDLEKVGFEIKAKEYHTIFGERFLWVSVTKN